jgi:hypothetical protein
MNAFGIRAIFPLPKGRRLPRIQIKAAAPGDAATTSGKHAPPY